jgi:hypothetical protein
MRVKFPDTIVKNEGNVALGLLKRKYRISMMRFSLNHTRGNNIGSFGIMRASIRFLFPPHNLTFKG